MKIINNPIGNQTCNFLVLISIPLETKYVKKAPLKTESRCTAQKTCMPV
jgi:hypothetical protein